jgi:hypothetical protein
MAVNTSTFQTRSKKKTLDDKGLNKKPKTAKKSSKKKKSTPKTHGSEGNKRFGKSNGRWKGGTSKTYRRRLTKAKTNDGNVVHHKDGNKKNNKPSNLVKVSPAKHNKLHPEKGGHNKGSKKKKRK